jgi:hypothetical protein
MIKCLDSIDEEYLNFSVHTRKRADFRVSGRRS